MKRRAMLRHHASLIEASERDILGWMLRVNTNLNGTTKLRTAGRTGYKLKHS